MNRSSRKQNSRLVALIAAVALLAATLTACTPSASSVNVADAFAKSGIATVPFAGGNPVKQVSGTTVLALTDWQVKSIQASMPAADGSWVGISAHDLDAQLGDAVADAASDPSIPSQVTPSWLVAVWWAHGHTARAKLARATFAAPDLHHLVSLPLYVVALFTADGFADFGRSNAAALSQPKAMAMGTGPALALDVCGTISGILAGATQFLDDAGLVGSALKGAISATITALDVVTGGLITLIKKIISIVNVILNIATLLTPWKIQVTANPSNGLTVGVNGEAGQPLTVTAKLVGVVDQPPKEVASCLGLFGIVNPTDQSGSVVDWADYDGYQPLLVSPSMLVPGKKQSALDSSNQATYTFTTGTEQVDTSKAEKVTDPAPYVDAGVKRADVAKISAWIKNELGSLLKGTPGTGSLADLVTSVADNIALIADPISVSVPVPVDYWTPKDQPKDQTGNGTSGHKADHTPLDPLPGCFAPAQIEDVTGLVVTKHYKGPGPSAGGTATAQNACVYEFDDKTAIGIEYPYPVPDKDGSLDLAYTQLLTDYSANCSEASGYLPASDSAGAIVLPYFIWSGSTLAATFWLGQATDPARELPHIARLAGLCA